MAVADADIDASEEVVVVLLSAGSLCLVVAEDVTVASV
jgi:hypothetical protein